VANEAARVVERWADVLDQVDVDVREDKDALRNVRCRQDDACCVEVESARRVRGRWRPLRDVLAGAPLDLARVGVATQHYDVPLVRDDEGVVLDGRVGDHLERRCGTLLPVPEATVDGVDAKKILAPVVERPEGLEELGGDAAAALAVEAVAADAVLP